MAFWQIEIAVDDFTTPSDHGAIGDGVADDSAALVACIQDGRPVEWGGPDKVYRVLTEIAETVTHAINWRSRGATIKYDGSGAPYAAVRLNVHPKNHQISGSLTFDGNNKAHNGIYLANASGTIPGAVWPSVTMTDIRAINILRSVFAFGSSCGILVIGAWEEVMLERPFVKDVKMLSAAHNVSVAGISGITVTRGGSTDYPKKVTIIDAHVENIYCSNNPAINDDQDGVVLFSRVNESSGAGADTSQMTVRGGTIKNSRGRSVKGQARNCIVSGVYVVKDSAVVGSGVSGSKAEIELQLGDGIVSDISFSLTGACCEDLVRVYSDSDVINGPSVVGNLRGVVSGVLPRAVAFMKQKIAGARVGFSVANISLQGVFQYFLLVDDNVAAATGVGGYQIANVVGTCSVAGVLANNALVGSGRLNMVNIVNNGSGVTKYSGNVGWTVQAQNVSGLS